MAAPGIEEDREREGPAQTLTLGREAGPPLLRSALLSFLTYPVPRHATSLAYALGGITFVGFLLLVLTGLGVAQFFNPQPDQAYRSVQGLMEGAWGGRYLRSLHYWTAQALLLALFLHLARVFITGAYRAPRAVTWWVGVGLFIIMLMGSYFTGTVLKGDQEGFEALTHYQAILQALGPFGYYLSEALPGGASLNVRLYVSHIAGFPLLLAVLMAAHFALVRIFNLAPLALPPGALTAEPTATFAEHLRNIVAASLVYYGAVAVVAVFVPAPLGPAAADVSLGEKPPWPFLWIYGLENIFGMTAILYGSVTLVAFLLLVPVLDRGRRPRGILIGGLAVWLIVLSLTVYAWLAPPQVHEGLHRHPLAPLTLAPSP